MNLGGYSSGGLHIIGWLFLIFYLVGPYLLIWLEVRAFRHSEAQSGMALIMLVILGGLACYVGAMAYQALPFFERLNAIQFYLTRIAAIAFPFALAWESYKRGWLAKLPTVKKPKKKKRRVRVDV